MGLLTKVEDRPTPPQVYNWRVYMTAAVVSFAAVMIGYDSAFIGGTLALPAFINEFKWGTTQKSVAEVNLLKANVVSLYQAGAFFGALFAYPAGHFLGRQKGLTIASVIFIIGAGIMLGANGDRGLGLIYGGRVLAGMGVGGASSLVPICKYSLSSWSRIN
jgi:MFS family permease